MQSIYEYVKGKIKDDGTLGDENIFSVQNNSNGVGFQDGALDGIMIYHFGIQELTDEEKDKLIEGLETALSGNEMSADAIFENCFVNFRALNTIGAVDDYISANRDKINPDALFSYGIHLAAESSNLECVKLGLCLLRFLVMGENTKEIVRVLGLSDELTLFSISCMELWEDGQAEILRLAQKVRGWGRVFAVDYLKPETEEIKKWLLYHGVENNVMPSYSGLLCYEKAGVPGILAKDTLTYDEFHAVLKIVDAMLNEGPVEGISGIDDPEGMLLSVMRHAKALMPLEIEDYVFLQEICLWQTEDGRNAGSEFSKLADDIFGSDDCVKTVKENIVSGRYINLAEWLGIPYKDDLLAAMRDNFDELYTRCRFLVRDPQYQAEVIDLFRKNLPLEKLKDGPGDETGFGPEFADNDKLNIIVQELGAVNGLGDDLIAAALQSKVTRSRNTALDVIKERVEKAEKPLSEIDAELYELLSEVKNQEVNDKTKAEMERILAGETGFNEWKL